MKGANNYVTVSGQAVDIGNLGAEERKLLARLRRRARTHADWNDFNNYWMREVAAFYDARRVSRSQSRQSPVYRIAQDLASRLGIATGMVRAPDYRVELEALIRNHFPNRRAFCKATGLSEDMLSHVLAGRKHLSLAALTDALDRIGYRLMITPAVRKRTG